MTSLREEHEWLVRNHSEVDKYAGKWVAILDGKIIAEGKSFQLVHRIATNRRPRTTPMIVYVPKKKEELLIV